MVSVPQTGQEKQPSHGDARSHTLLPGGLWVSWAQGSPGQPDAAQSRAAQTRVCRPGSWAGARILADHAPAPANGAPARSARRAPPSIPGPALLCARAPPSSAPRPRPCLRAPPQPLGSAPPRLRPHLQAPGNRWSRAGTSPNSAGAQECPQGAASRRQARAQSQPGPGGIRPCKPEGPLRGGGGAPPRCPCKARAAATRPRSPRRPSATLRGAVPADTQCDE